MRSPAMKLSVSACSSDITDRLVASLHSTTSVLVLQPLSSIGDVPPRFLQGIHSLSVTFFWFILPKSRLTAHLHSIAPLFSHLWNQLPQSPVLPYRASRQLFNTTSGHSPSILMIPFTPKWLHYPALPFSTLLCSSTSPSPLFISQLSVGLLLLPLKVKGGYIITCLFICLWAWYLQKLWTDSDKTWWTGWVWDKNELIRFCWRSGSGSDNFLKMILHYRVIGLKTI